MLGVKTGRCHGEWLGITIALGISSGIAFGQTTVLSQNIILDGTLGQEKILAGHRYNIFQGFGQTAGINLFHSFKQFNLDAGEIAIFHSDPSIKNILSRVTGGSASLINGQISTTSSNVNLYLINPSGIVFGSDASIKIGSETRGSFVATTANAIGLGGRGAFIASTSQTDVSLLTVNPSAFLFNQLLAQPITSQARLKVEDNQSLILLGGNLQLNGGGLIARGGRVELGSIAGSGIIDLNADGSELHLSFPVGVPRGDISLDNGAQVNVRTSGGGSIVINAGNLNLLQESQLKAGVDAALGTNSRAGDIEINATQTINITHGSSIVNTVQSGAASQGGDITITTGSLVGTNGSFFSTSTSGQGDAGNVNIRATGAVSFDGVNSNQVSGGVYSRVENGAFGNGGDIDITTGSLLMTNGARLTASTLGEGDAGNVNIRATGTVSFDGVGSNGFSSGGFSAVGLPAVGNGGSVNIATGGLLSISNGAVVGASTRGEGNGGNITLNTHRLGLVNGGQILTTSRNRSSGRAGNITVNATDSVTLSGNDPTYAARLSQFNRIRVLNVSPVSGLFANTTNNSTGRGGNVRIDTRRLVVENRAEVNVSSQGGGNAGSLRVNADSILLGHQGKLTASTASGTGGNIILRVQDLLLMRRNSLISTEAGTSRTGGGGKGGNIDINSRLIVAIPSENSDIVANAFDGPGGNINITTQGIFGIEPRQRLTSLSDITASSDFGVNGTVQINTPDVNPSRGLTELPSEVIDAQGLIDRRCDPKDQNAQRSSFIVTGRGGMPPNPGDVLRDDALLVDWVTLDSNTVNKTYPVTTTPNRSTPSPLVEAQGWVVNNNGQIILTAQAQNVTPYGKGFDSVECSLKQNGE